MIFTSTNDQSISVSFREALLNGLAPDGGLYVPTVIPKLDKSFIDNLENYSFQEIAFEIASNFIEDEIPTDDLKKLISDSINFPAPIKEIKDNLYILELFHGPTLAFKDFGARFMSAAFSYFMKDEINILVATSGDTGSAVAGGFYKKKGINVYLLYPSNMVSKIQEQQLTTWGENITAIEVKGTFDDCQRFVKTAFTDDEVKAKMNLSSANSINIARLLPQIFYYVEAYKQVKDKSKETIITVPSGNLGNLTAGLIAKKMGLPIKKFIAATNANDVFTKYVNSGNFEPRDSVRTISNAMDVGNPSNFARILSSYNNIHNEIKDDIYSASFNDEETIDAIKEVYKKFNYIIDPHGGVGFLAAKKYSEDTNIQDTNSIILETAHPAKFLDIVESAVNVKVEIPKRLEECLNKKKQSIVLSKEYTDFKDFLLASNALISKRHSGHRSGI